MSSAVPVDFVKAFEDANGNPVPAGSPLAVKYVDAIDDTVGRHVVERTSEAGERREQVRLVDDVVDDLTRLDGAGPPSEGGNADPPFEEGSFTSREDGLECFVRENPYKMPAKEVAVAVLEWELLEKKPTCLPAI